MSTEAVAGRVVADRYELVEPLGTGSMGTVWRARDRLLQREVAVREVELPDILDDAEQAALAEKVLREASAASELDHPGAVTVLDVVTEAGQPFVVSELVRARTLVDVVTSDGPLDPDHAAALGLRVLDALAAAHDLGLVHRDVRPSNVLLTGTGVRLADFGVASMVDDPRITGHAMHEPSYLAPEQTESAGATALSDLWSLGATLYFAVEGVAPFDGGMPAATITAIVNDAPRPARRAGTLQPVFDALLVKDAMDRPDDDATRALLATATGELGPGVGPPPPAWSANGGPATSDTIHGTDDRTQSSTTADLTTADLTTADLTTADHPAADDPAADDPAAYDPAPGSEDTGREPWFFQVPVETVPPPPLPEPLPRPEVEPERPPGRLPRGVWAALLAALVAGVMVALIVTGGHTFRAQRPSIDTSKGPGALTTWVPYSDSATGFTIRYPASWSIRRNGSQTFFVDPAGLSYLEVDHQQPPAASLTASAYDQEKSFAATHPNYQRIGIEQTTYQERPASLWQFTYTDAGTNIRAADLGVNSPKYGFALYFQARADDWTRAQGTFDNFKSAFGIPT